jgi:transposase
MVPFVSCPRPLTVCDPVSQFSALPHSPARPRASLPLRSVCTIYLSIPVPMYHVICREVKDLMIIGLGRGKSVKELAKLGCCSERTVRRVRLNWRRYGDVAPPRRGPTGCPRLFDRQAVDHLLGVLEALPDSFLDELQPALAAFMRRDGRVDQASLMTVSRMLSREGITTKALSGAQPVGAPPLCGLKSEGERELMARYCRLKRMRYQLAIANYQPEQFVFVDETRKDDRTTYRRRGRARRGHRAESRVQFVRGVGYSVLPALTIDGFLSAKVLESAFTKETFERFIFVAGRQNPLLA